jgi:hypothetical protein
MSLQEYPGIGFTRTDLVEIRDSDHGLGLFAIKAIPKNTRVTSWSGSLLTKSNLEHVSANERAYAISLRNNTELVVNGFGLRQGVNDGKYDLSRLGIGWLANSGPHSCRTEYISQRLYRKLLQQHGFTDEEVSRVIRTCNLDIIMLTTNRLIYAEEELVHNYTIRESSV